ncbi:MAG: DegV family EDD domain-containing protein [Lachnospiraceae bacterium]|nr:DegV family EDD domain-containing protein [Lachnospiraceae bacterium]
MKKYFERNKESEKYVYQSSLKVAFWFFVALTLYEVVHVLYTFAFPGEYGEFVLWSRIAYGASGVVLGLFSAVYFYAGKDFENRYKLLPIANVTCTFAIYALAVVVTVLDSIRSGVMDTTLIMFMGCVIPILLYMPLAAYLTLFLLSNGAVLYYYITLYMKDNLKYVAVKYYAIFIVLWIIVSIIILYVKYSMYDRILESDRQKEEIEKLNDAQNRFFSSMSHEIRTPINTIIGLNEMILRENVSDEVNEDAANIRSASNMLLHLINDILDMSKLDSGQMQLTPVSYRTGDMLSDIVGMLWIRAKDKGLEFKVDVAPDLPGELYGDEVRIKQIIINVLNNAIKYTKDGSVTLNIQCRREESNNVTVIYSISDTGMGIKKESIPYLFTAFKRVDETENRYIEGTGLGLSIVKQLVDLMGGKITVNSVYTKGSTFIIEIPQRTVSGSTLGNVDLSKRNSILRMESYHQSFEAPEANILVVDDTETNLMVVEKLLRETKVNLVTATSAKEALEKTTETEFHVIFMDHLMPEIDGIECLHMLREQKGGLCRESKVVALTANAGGDTKALYVREGFDGYLVKPVSGESLENELRRLLPKELVTVTSVNDEILEESTLWIKDHQAKAEVCITTESVADIPSELAAKYNITVIPHLIYTEDGVFKDGLEIETSGLLSYMEDESKYVETKAPDIAYHESFFAKQLEHANNVVHISISSTLENSAYHAASEAAKSFDNVFVINSGHLSSGQGLLALTAARFAEEGYGAEEIVEMTKASIPRVHTSFVVDSMDYLARAKQIGKKTADIVKALLIHPVLSMKKGKLGLGGIYFGSREGSWRKYINSSLTTINKIDKRMLFVTYVGINNKEKEEIRAEIEKKMEFEKIYFQQASPAIAVNCGPGTFGLLYMIEE